MKLREIMSSTVVRIHPEETVAVAARMLEHNNIGALPVCGGDGRLCGMVSLGDLANREESIYDAGDALAEISGNLSNRDTCP